jgi:hypothetical protein
VGGTRIAPAIVPRDDATIEERALVAKGVPLDEGQKVAGDFAAFS